MIRRRRIPPGDLGYRGQARASAHVYGDVLVLAATAGVSHPIIRSGQAAALVAATVVSTYLAHVLADVAGAAVTGLIPARVALRHEIRDSLPIVIAGLPSLALFAAADVGWLAAGTAQDVASAVLVVRIATVGLIYRRFNPSLTVGRAVALGFAAAGVAAIVTALKLAFTH